MRPKRRQAARAARRRHLIAASMKPCASPCQPASSMARGREEQQPVDCAPLGGRRRAAPAPSPAATIIAAGRIGDDRGPVLRPAVDDDHLADDALGGGGNQRRQRMRKACLVVAGGDDHADHDPVIRPRNRIATHEIQANQLRSYCSCFVLIRALGIFSWNSARPPSADPLGPAVRSSLSASASIPTGGADAAPKPIASGRFEPLARGLRRRRLGIARRTAAAQDRGAGGAAAQRSSPATIRPDISFDRSINPYRGCEHGCAYCFARPTPRLYGAFAGARFRNQAVRQAERGARCSRRSWPSPATKSAPSRSAPTPIPTSRSSGATASCARSWRCSTASNHPVGIVTKSALVAARHRYPVAHGGAQSRQGRAVGDDARPAAWRGRWSRGRRRRRGGWRR